MIDVFMSFAIALTYEKRLQIRKLMVQAQT